MKKENLAKNVRATAEFRCRAVLQTFLPILLFAKEEW